MFRLTHSTPASRSQFQREFGEGAAAIYVRAAQRVGLDPRLSFGRQDKEPPILTLAMDGRDLFEIRQIERRIHALVEMEDPRYFGHILFRWHAALRADSVPA